MRRESFVVAAVLTVYAMAFLLWPPPTTTVVDENNYVRQAQLILGGGPTLELEDPITGELVEVRPINHYPLGTALLLLPFIATGGRAAAPFLSLLCVLVAVGVTARWLRESGRSPVWALLVIAYPATAVMGRVAMSEAPSLAVTATGLWLFFRGARSEGSAAALAFGAAGFLAGASIAFREANVLVFAPFFLGSVMRRDPGGWALVAGGLAGLGVRMVSAALFFGDPFFTKAPDPFTLASLSHTLPLYALSLLVLCPGGLIAAAAYRGERRPELLVTVATFVVFHLSYSYSALESSWAKRLVLGGRYFIPLLPLLAFAAADVWPRWLGGVWNGLGARFGALQRAAVPALASGLALGLAGVQWAHAEWAQSQAVIRDAIYEATPPDEVIVSNTKATGKFVDFVDGERLVLDRRALGAAGAAILLERRGGFYLVLLDRSDSDYWRRDAFDNAAFLAGLPGRRELELDLRVTSTDRLRVWRVSD